MVLICALLGALVLSASAGAKTSKYCHLIPERDLGKPVGVSGLRVTSVIVPYPAATNVKGKVTFCQHATRKGLTVQTIFTRLSSAPAAQGEFVRAIHGQRDSGRFLSKVRGPWDDGYFLGGDGMLVIKGRFMVRITYDPAVPGYDRVSEQTFVRFARKATRKL